MTAERFQIIARANVLGIGVHALDMEQTLAAMGSAIEAGRKGYICLADAHGIVEAFSNPAVRAALEGAFLVAPDGMPTVWMGRLQGLRHMRRVVGPELMLEAFQRRELARWRHFFCGGAPGVAEQLRHDLLARFPGASIVGTYTPPFSEMTDNEVNDLAERVRQTRPDIVWVGISTPKQEMLMARLLPLLDTRLMAGVGAAFLYHTGAIEDSPAWLKAAGLQWLHRLLQEPRRLWRRYLTVVPRFLFHAVLQIAGMSGYEMSHASSIAPEPGGPPASTAGGTQWQ